MSNAIRLPPASRVVRAARHTQHRRDDDFGEREGAELIEVVVGDDYEAAGMVA